MESTLDRLNEVLTYIEFFKSSMTDYELLTAIQDQMDKYNISKEFISNFYNIHITRPYMTPGPINASTTLPTNSSRLY